VDDISVGGANLLIEHEFYRQIGCCGSMILEGVNPVNGDRFRLPLEIMSCWTKGDKQSLGIRFLRQNLAQYRDIVLLAHGDSRRWVEWSDHRADDPGLFHGIYYLTNIGFRYLCRYLFLFSSRSLSMAVYFFARLQTARQVRK
jgi:hypothetical protein